MRDYSSTFATKYDVSMALMGCAFVLFRWLPCLPLLFHALDQEPSLWGGNMFFRVSGRTDSLDAQKVKSSNTLADWLQLLFLSFARA